MTLKPAERQATSEQLTANLGLSGLTRQQVCEDLDFSDDELEASLELRELVDPVDVWVLRDYLELAVRQAGAEPVAYTVLTEEARTEAYKWYVIAGRAGDATARSRATALRAQLTAEAQQTADRSALAFRPQAQTTASLSPSAAPAANANLGLAQRVLSQLGYYQGPRDGVASPALRMAIAAYQRDQGLPASGSVDGETLNKLSVYAR